MRKITIEIYSFNELSDKAKEKALVQYYDWHVNFDWWESVCQDAKEIGMVINKDAKGYFINDAITCAYKVQLHHDKDCDTYRSAIFYLSERDAILNNAPNDEEDDREYYESLDKCNEDFLKSILEDYSIMLRRDYEYLTSDETITDTFKANDIEFTADGKIYKF